MVEATPGPRHEEHVQHPERHERYDINVRALVIAGIVAVIAGFLVHALLAGTFHLFEKEADRADQGRALSAVPKERVETPEPRLQGIPGFHPNTPQQDRAELEARVRQRLASYGTTEEGGYVRIPIERAMELLLERGLSSIERSLAAPPEGAAPPGVPTPPGGQGQEKR